LGNRRLPNCLRHKKGRVLPIKLHHQFDVALGEAFLFRQFVVQAFGQSRNHPRAPAFLLLPGINQATDIPVQGQQLLVDRQNGASLTLPDTLLDLGQQTGVKSHGGGFLEDGEVVRRFSGERFLAHGLDSVITPLQFFRIHAGQLLEILSRDHRFSCLLLDILARPASHRAAVFGILFERRHAL